MATRIGNVTEFDPQSEKIKDYLERARLYMDANSVADDKKVAVLLSVIGKKTYALLTDLLAPDLPRTKTYDEITATLEKHFEPKRAVIAERFHFHKRDQAVGESMADYEAALRRLTINCDFGEYLEQALRDRFVCGLRSEAVQRRLLSEKTLTRTKAMELAQGMEAAEKSTKSFKAPELSINHFQPQSNSPCYRCGRKGHTPQDCKFKDAECHACGKKGHISSACRSKSRSSPSTNPPKRGAGRKKFPRRHGTKWVANEAAGNEEPSETEEFFLHAIEGKSSTTLTVDVTANGKTLPMEVDTGAALSLISEKTRKSIFPEEPLLPSNVVLKTYTNEKIDVTGQLNLHIEYAEQRKPLVLIVVAGDGPSLFGRNWLKYIRLNWSRIATVTDSNRLQGMLDKHSAVFNTELGTIQPYQATLLVEPQAPAKFYKPRPVPFATKDAIGQELDRLEREGIVKRVTHSDWSAPIVAVPKKDGKFRICGDFKVTINQALAVDQYPLPKPDDLFATLSGGKKFTKLDHSQAYLQLALDKKSQEYVTVNTHQGLYRYTRLPFGVASAPAMFQKIMDQILQGIPHVICYIDDILITEVDEAEHFNNLEMVLARLEEHGIRIKKEKCSFMQEQVEYLGHQISSTGLHAIPEKVKAIVQAPRPSNVTELRSFLGLLNYYGKFIPNLATILHPLNDLLKSDTQWKWSEVCDTAFKTAKDKLTSSQVLTHYNPELPLKMAADASAYGVGAVISHVFPDVG